MQHKFYLLLLVLMSASFVAAGRRGTIKRLRFGHRFRDRSPNRLMPRGWCGFPNIIESQRTNPARIAGDWLEYGEYSSTPPGLTKGLMSVEILIENTVNAATASPAVVLKRIFTYNLVEVNGNKCDYHYSVGYLGYDGNFFELNYSPKAEDPTTFYAYHDRAPDQVVYTDYDSVLILGACFQPNFDIDLCNNPYIYILTRTQRDQMSDWDQRQIREKIDRALAKFCLSSRDINLYSLQGTANCQPSPPACFNTAVDGYKQAALKPTPNARDWYSY